jgi:hypothetical protein
MREVEGRLPKVDIITHGGEKTREDEDNQPKIHKASPKDDMYDPLKQKIFFKDAVEIFRGEFSPEIRENPPKVTLQPKTAQAPASPLAPRNNVNSRRPREQSQNIINLWFQLFSEILGDDRLSKKFHNTFYLILGDEGTPETTITTNLLEKNTQRVQRRKVRIGNFFRLEAQLDDFEIKDVMLDLGSDVNILPKNTWEVPRKLQLVYFPIQLRRKTNTAFFQWEHWKMSRYML